MSQITPEVSMYVRPRSLALVIVAIVTLIAPVALMRPRAEAAGYTCSTPRQQPCGMDD